MPSFCPYLPTSLRPCILNTITGGTADSIDIEGDGNTAGAGVVEDISVEGDDDTVTDQTGEPARCPPSDLMKQAWQW